ncbi:DUF1735 and LamG domain-containing protein [Chitinophaga defluvii]|uniref:DUF1735 and LamG domain-containing protein n=1 Tax=Chitinophaga defluvii TaxID=3163343 RepID=A0ABV2T8E6_9BACT
MALITCIISISCKKEHYTDALYITGTEENTSTSLTVDNSPVSTAISVTSSGLATSDITVQLAIDTSLIPKYSQANGGKSFKALPAGTYKLSADKVTIKAGSSISDAITFNIQSPAQISDGAGYLVPVKINSVSGGPRVLESSRVLYIIVRKVVRMTVASLTGNYFKVDFSQNNATLKNMTAISYETRVMVNNFQGGSPFISSVMGIEENFLMRFGDVTIDKNQLQMAGGTTALTVPTGFSTGVWYHVAVTYDGNVENIYVNGTLMATKTAARTVDLTSGDFFIGRSAGGRLLDGAVSECRVWSRALSKTEIVNGLCGVDPASKGLEAYWKMNEGEGNIIHDISGHGRNAIAAGTVQWIPGVRCDQ